MDDSNSYWWLVRVLKTQEVGYIPAENIETPFERLARLNKHRNVDLASATQSELQSDLNVSASRLRTTLAAGGQSTNSSSPLPPPNAPRTGNTVPNPLSQRRGLAFSPGLSVHRYPPAVWNEEEWLIEREERRATIISKRGGDPDADYTDYDDLDFDDEEDEAEWEVGAYEAEDCELADEMTMMRRMTEQAMARDAQQAKDAVPAPQSQKIMPPMEPDDGMQWEDGAAAAQQAAAAAPRPSPEQMQNVQPQPQQQPLRTPRSAERLTPDPAEVSETRKVTVTPSIARDVVSPTSADSEKERERERERKRLRDEEEEAARKRARQPAAPAQARTSTPVQEPVSSPNPVKSPTTPTSGGKLRKEREPAADEEKDGKKKKSGGVFGSLFGRKGDKKDKGKNASIGSDSEFAANTRGSEESGRRPSNGSSAPADGMISPTTATAMQQQQQQQATSLRNSTDPKRIQQMQAQQKEQSTTMSAASQLRQRDQQQQALYQQYLNRSPSSPPEAQPSYGLQSAAPYMNSSSTPPSAFHSPPSGGRQRPGSLILTPSSSGDGVGVPDLSVIRVFAGQNLDTEATFKTVLLNASTTSADLVRQAVQRFRLEDTDPHEYFLTVKQVEGSSAVLRDSEHPLVVFEGLVENAPRVKRSSVGSINSVASNLSMHPAIKKLDMNDFTDDSAVKFYLNRRGGEEGADTSMDGADDTLIAETVDGEIDPQSPGRGQFLTVSTQGGNNVQPERFTSPSFRFPLQLAIFPGDLPDDMVFDPLTEAIVFKDTLKERGRPSVTSPGISQTIRRKVFVFPKNATVAEVIELGLERFGIEEGVVDGGDEVEDKLSKRRSAVRVRYQLTIDTGNGQERELCPSSRVVDAFPRPPSYRNPQSQFPNKRRSVDSAQILGTMEDVNPDDPMFILRRATSYRPSTNSHARHRVSLGLDELALAKQKLQRDSASSTTSDAAVHEESKIRVVAPTSGLSRQEIIAAQREATRANQRAILSASTNSVRGMDVLLPGNAMIRSARYNADEKMRYSYVQPDGESYDISDIVEEEWRDSDDKTDVLEGVLGRNKDRVGEKLDRVLSKIQSGGRQQQAAVPTPASVRSNSPESQYSLDDAARSRSVTPGSAGLVSRTPIPANMASEKTQQSVIGRASPSVRPGTSTPTGAKSGQTPSPLHPGLVSRRQESVTSVMSDDVSGYATPMAPSSPESPMRTPTPKAQQKRVVIPKDEFGVAHMMTVIELRGSVPRKPLSSLDPVDELLFGRPIDLPSLHPKIREVYADSVRQMNDVDKMLDDYFLNIKG
ncbi:heat shock protein [Favolaschia claudopus]|uniref:Heat shock protein n=1 Tax=Favolaschia claudopus TaxID=2862362 RepID=A0AAV9ZGS3_9AGAR